MSKNLKKTAAVIACVAVAALGVVGGKWIYPALTSMMSSWQTSSEIRSAMGTLAGTNEAQRIAAIIKLGWNGKSSKEVLHTLEGLTNGQSQKERIWAYSSLAVISDSPKPHIDQLVRIVQENSDFGLRFEAARAIAGIGTKALDAVPVLNAFRQEAVSSGKKNCQRSVKTSHEGSNENQPL